MADAISPLLEQSSGIRRMLYPPWVQMIQKESSGLPSLDRKTNYVHVTSDWWDVCIFTVIYLLVFHKNQHNPSRWIYKNLMDQGCWTVLDRFFEAGSSGNRGAFQVWRTDSGGKQWSEQWQIVGSPWYPYFICNAFWTSVFSRISNANILSLSPLL